MRPERAILTVALLAAFAGGAKHDRERDEIRCIADVLDLARLYQDVLLKRTSLDAARVMALIRQGAW